MTTKLQIYKDSLELVKMLYLAMPELNKREPNASSVERFRCVVNSYLGHMGNFATFNIRKRLVGEIDEEWWKYFTVSNDLKKVVLKKQFERIEITKQKIKNNRRKRNYVSRTYKQEMAADS